MKLVEKKQKACLENLKGLKNLFLVRQLSFYGRGVIFIESTLVRSPKKVLIVFYDQNFLRKWILQSIVNYDFM